MLCKSSFVFFTVILILCLFILTKLGRKLPPYPFACKPFSYTSSLPLTSKELTGAQRGALQSVLQLSAPHSLFSHILDFCTISTIGLCCWQLENHWLIYSSHPSMRQIFFLSLFLQMQTLKLKLDKKYNHDLKIRNFRTVTNILPSKNELSLNH